VRKTQACCDQTSKADTANQTDKASATDQTNQAEVDLWLITAQLTNEARHPSLRHLVSER